MTPKSCSSALRLIVPLVAVVVLSNTTLHRARAQDDDWLPASVLNESPLLRTQGLTEQPALYVRGQSPEDLAALEATANTPVRVPTQLDAPVTSLTLTESTVAKSPAAVFVIDQEMIRRSGAQTVPEILRMVPGVHVGVGNGLSPNVGIRGMGASNRLPFSARVLVLIDGRSIYEPTSGGVSWNRNDLILQDIERIEVIRGPGATIWGANAVNGVINIITKSAEDTQGTLVQGLGGSYYHTIGVARHGTKVGDDGFLRVYGKYRDFGDQVRDPEDAAFSIPFRNEPANDGFHDFLAGFRYDNSALDEDQVSVQGRIAAMPAGSERYRPITGAIDGPKPAEYFVGSLQSTWTHEFDNETALKLISIYDRADSTLSFGAFTRDSYILDAAYSWTLGERHRLLAGGQYRLDRDTILPLKYPINNIGADPASRIYSVTSWLIQDDIELIPDDLSLLVGTKMEVNPFTAFEIQPSVRLLKTLDEQRVVWASYSHAIRRPNRIDENVLSDLHFTAFPNTPIATIMGNAQLQADVVDAFELGYRAAPTDWLTWDIASFANFYSDLPVATSIIDLGNPVSPVQTMFQNGAHAESYGAELTATVEMTDTWKVTGSYSYLAVFAHSDIPSAALDQAIDEVFLYEGTSPRNIVYVRNSWSPTKEWDVDLINRYVDQLTFGNIPSYIELDIRLAWRPREGLELAVMGMNLLDASHLEYESREFANFNPLRTEVPRSIYGSVTYMY